MAIWRRDSTFATTPTPGLAKVGLVFLDGAKKMRSIKKLATSAFVATLLVGCGLGGPERANSADVTTGDTNTGYDSSDATDETDNTDATDTTDGTDGPDVTDGSDASDTTDTTDSTDTTDATDGGEGFKPCPTEHTCTSSEYCNSQGQCVPKAVPGEDGEAGASCTAVYSGDGDAIAITCGTDVQVLNGCTVVDQKGGALVTCGFTSVFVSDGVQGQPGPKGDQGEPGEGCETYDSAKPGCKLIVCANTQEELCAPVVTGCMSDFDCPDFETCVDGDREGIAYQVCNLDTHECEVDHVSAGNICEFGCEAGECVSECTTSAQCGSGQACEDGKCVDIVVPECVTDAQCPQPQFYCSGATPVAVVYSCLTGSCVSYTEGGDECTYGCSAGGCKPAPNCNDGIACTSDSIINSGCVHTPNNQACEDGNPCSINTCSEAAGGCVHTANNAMCNDNNACTNDFCGATGCMNTPNVVLCNDGNACTVNDHCGNGTCSSAVALDCDDGDIKTADSCDPLTGCKHVTIPVVPSAWSKTVEFTCPATNPTCEIWAYYNNPGTEDGKVEIGKGKVSVTVTESEACTPNGIQVAVRTLSGNYPYWGCDPGTPSKSTIGATLNGQSFVPGFKPNQPWACGGNGEGNLFVSPAQLGCPGY